MDNDGGDYVRSNPIWPGVPHYYGNTVRQLFLANAALILIGAPFYADTLSAELPFEIIGALVLAGLAALVNPHNRSFIFANAVAAGIGLLFYETWALSNYEVSTWAQFIWRELIAVIFLTAFYFSMKTVRAFVLHQIGKSQQVGEFDEDVKDTWEEPVPARRKENSGTGASSGRFKPESAAKPPQDLTEAEKQDVPDAEEEEEEEEEDESKDRPAAPLF
ncbi:hypothetical protein A3D71_04240 [Candidatus Kaiserbacteria bacterium RIFCSPHIGHO2_02_FULL_55_20]|uniref:Transmembrane protein n=1 Tax=Candidatus Kaiserbacteria bacterium RIFCSPHIGHO2_02_FULL_55_20 TaxID=1798497 RepID=A0A1F6DWG3_9BACT|nr:MAG: hypothetical protein A3D71_04240 [Candidatus Kaiserbacteria bacterium RIFCSPHIGHO2_02_FULL_55_20]